jgi:hypothetical protein
MISSGREALRRWPTPQEDDGAKENILICYINCYIIIYMYNKYMPPWSYCVEAS